MRFTTILNPVLGFYPTFIELQAETHDKHPGSLVYSTYSNIAKALCLFLRPSAQRGRSPGQAMNSNLETGLLLNIRLLCI